MNSLDERLCKCLWGVSEYQWMGVEALGSAGGMLSIGNKEEFKFIFSFSDLEFCGAHGEWGKDKKKCFIVNVYSPCSLAGKRKMWADLLMSKRGFGDGIWCFTGDFNVVLKSSERRGVSSQHRCPKMKEFQLFVQDMKLIDLPVLGRRFTLFRANSSTMRRIDRVLVSEDWLTEW